MTDGISYITGFFPVGLIADYPGLFRKGEDIGEGADILDLFFDGNGFDQLAGMLLILGEAGAECRQGSSLIAL